MIRMIKIANNFTVRKLLYNKRFTVPFSIFMAFVLWLVIMINQNPIIDRSFASLPVNINLENTFVAENGMDIIGDISDQKFTVVVQGPNYIVSSLKTEDFNIFASAASVNTPGEYNLEVTGIKNTGKSGFEILSVTPSTVTVTFDYIDTKEFTIEAMAEGATASEGLIAENSVVSGTESDTITIKGPRTVINKIDTVVAYASVNKTLSSTQTFDAEIQLFDEQKNPIDSKNLTLSAAKVKVTVPISKKATVPVKADFTNLPAGFSKESIMYTIDHGSVTVIGTPEIIDKTTQVTLSAIDLTNISTTSNRFDVSPKLPEGIRLLDTIDHFTVSIDTSNYIEKTFNISRVKYTDLASGFTASAGASVKNVKICGPKSVMNKLQESMLYAEVNLSNKKAGEHTVTVSIRSDNYNNIWQVGSYSTTVTIK